MTGFPGSAAAFVALALWGNPPSRTRVPGALTERFIAPASRIALAAALADQGGEHAAIDIRDGLGADLARLAAASGVGARVVDELLPGDEAIHGAVRALTAAAGQERGPLPAEEGELLPHLQLGPGDDYELLLAVDPAAWERCEALAAAHGAPLTLIGGFTAEPALERVRRGGAAGPLEPRGWDHFA